MPKDIPKILGIMRAAVDTGPVVSSGSPFRVLIATVLSQRTRDKNTERAASRLFKKYGSASSLANAPIAEVRKLVRPAGFYRVKAARLREISRQIVGRFGGKTPKDIEGLLSLPGVGRKTANCVLVYGFKKPAMPVDVHVHRISNRIGLAETKTPGQTEIALREAVPKRHWLALNHLMVKYGQQVCLPRHPKCLQCGIGPSCAYFLANFAKKQL